MTTNTELIASFPEINPANYTDDDVNALNAWGISAHSAIEALEAERDALQAQLAAAQGQEPVAYMVQFSPGSRWVEVTKVEFDSDIDGATVYKKQTFFATPIPQQPAEPIGFVESAVRGAGGFHACFSSGVFIPAGTQLYAAPITQPERAPLSLQEIADAWGLKPENIPASDIEAVREIEAAIKQGGQQ